MKPLSGNTKHNLTIGGLLVLISILIYVLIYALTHPQVGDDVVHQSRIDGSVEQVEDYLKKNLNDPGSYESIEWGTLEIQGTGNQKYSIAHKYRAKNSFGAYVIGASIFYMDENGAVTRMVDLLNE